MSSNDLHKGLHEGIAPALGAANLPLKSDSGKLPPSLAQVRFPAEDGGHSLAEMAHRDLDAALQLLAFRAQYITEASGAAIAIRRHGRNDMVCRASSGANAPELGTLLSTESGLSGESVRTRLPLLCVDTERDPRVNRDGCRELGIASVAVMPIIGDDGVFGVFELFSGKAGAFGERDIAALKRLAEMAQTAVELTEAARAVSQVVDLPPIEEEFTDVDVSSVMESEVNSLEAENAAPVVSGSLDSPPNLEAEPPKAVAAPADAVKPQSVAATQAHLLPSPEKSSNTVQPKKLLLWSAAFQPSAEATLAQPIDQSRVPPVLRDLSKCWSCGFPVSEGRKLCVECEEKQWRGQLRTPTAAPAVAGKVAVSWSGEEPSRAIATPAAVAKVPNFSSPGSQEPPSNQAIAFAAKAGISLPARVEEAGSTLRSEKGTNPEITSYASPVAKAQREDVPIAGTTYSESQSLPKFSAGLGSSESWFSSNKYILGTILLIAAATAAVFFLR